MKTLSILLVLALLVSCSSGSSAANGSSVDSRQGFELRSEALVGGGREQAASVIPEQCLKVVRDYIKRTRGWDATMYLVDGEDLGTSGRGFSIGLLSEMKVLQPPGGGESFHVDTDRACSRVMSELAYQ